MDLLTPSVNVPAERAKLRRLRNEINAEAQARLEYQRHYTARGYRRAQVPELHPMPNPQNQPTDRTGQHGLPDLLRQAGGQDTPGQDAGQSHAGRDCKAPRKPAESGCTGACGRCGAGVKA